MLSSDAKGVDGKAAWEEIINESKERFKDEERPEIFLDRDGRYFGNAMHLRIGCPPNIALIVLSCVFPPFTSVKILSCGRSSSQLLSHKKIGRRSYHQC